MTQESEPKLYDLSRRKMLAGVGAVGLASAGAGFGTSALFSDTETFENNTLTAGELDLLVDWQQTYSYSMGGEETTTFVSAHPDHDGDGEQSIAADNDAGQLKYSDFPDEEDEDSNGANIPNLDCESIPPLSEADFGTDPVTDEEMDTLVQLTDIKPGDSGEITFSLHLCDNPGYIWMQAGNISEDDGVDTDPELAVDETELGDLGEAIQATLWYDEDCDNVYDPEAPADIMLTLDFSGSMLYRQFGGVVSENPIDVDGDGANEHSETTKIDLVEKGTRQFIDYLQAQNADVTVGVAYFDGERDDDTEPRVGILEPLTSNLSAVDTALSGLRQKLANVVSGAPTSTPFDGDGNPNPSAGNNIAEGTFIGEGVDAAQVELTNNGRSGIRDANLVLSDGESFNGQGSTQFSDPTESADNARAPQGSPVHTGTNAPPASVETDVFTLSVGSANDAVLQAMAGPANGAGSNLAFFNDIDNPLNIPTVFGNLAAQFVGEKKIMEDSLANVLATLADGNGMPLDGNRSTIYDELSDPANDPDRDAFRGDGVMHCVALSWELPFETGNEVQGDTLGFDLGFYTEQARYNDGSGSAQA